eukprot:768587-Hanusia_phi.AAC.7
MAPNHSTCDVTQSRSRVSAGGAAAELRNRVRLDDPTSHRLSESCQRRPGVESPSDFNESCQACSTVRGQVTDSVTRVERVTAARPLSGRLY